MMLSRVGLLFSLLLVSASATAQISLIAAYTNDHQYESLRVSLDGKRLYGEERIWFGHALDAKNGQIIDASTGPTPLLSLEDQEFVNGETELFVWDMNWGTRLRSFQTGLGGGEVTAVISESKNRIFVARPKSSNVVAFDASGKYIKYLRRNGLTHIPMQAPVKPFKNEKGDHIIVHRSVFGMTSLAFIGDLPGTLMAKSNDGTRYLCRSDAGELVLVRASNLETIWARSVKSEGGTGAPVGFHNAEFVEHDEFILALSSEYTESGATRTALVRFDLNGVQATTPFYSYPISDSRTRFTTNPVSRRVYVTLPTTRFPGNPMRLSILSYGPGASVVKPYLTQITGDYDLKSPGRNRSDFEVFGQRSIDSKTGRDVERPMLGFGEIAADSRNKVNRSGQRLDFTSITTGATYSYQVPTPAYTALPIGVIDSYTALWPVTSTGGGGGFARLAIYRTNLLNTKDLGSVNGANVIAPGNYGHFATQDGTKINVYSYGKTLSPVGSTGPISELMWATISAADRLTVVAAHRLAGPVGRYDLYRYIYRLDSQGVSEISRVLLAASTGYPRVAISSDGTRAAIYSFDIGMPNEIVVFNLATGTPMATFPMGNFSGPTSMIMIGNNRLVASDGDYSLILKLPD